MPATLRMREVPRAVDGYVRDPADSALDGDWCITISRSSVDGQLSMQLENRRSPAVLSAIDGTDVSDLEGLLRRLSATASTGRPARRK